MFRVKCAHPGGGGVGCADHGALMSNGAAGRAAGRVCP